MWANTVVMQNSCHFRDALIVTDPINGWTIYDRALAGPQKQTVKPNRHSRKSPRSSPQFLCCLLQPHKCLLSSLWHHVPGSGRFHYLPLAYLYLTGFWIPHFVCWHYCIGESFACSFGCTISHCLQERLLLSPWFLALPRPLLPVGPSHTHTHTAKCGPWE